MSDIVTSPLEPPRSIVSALQRLRARLAAWLLLDGAAGVAGAVVIWSVLDLAIDYLAHLDIYQRAIMLGLGVAAVLFILWRRLLRPLLATASDEALCLRVERSHPHLGERLIAALEFSKLPPDKRGDASPAMIAATIDSGAAAAAGEVDFSSILNTRRMNRNIAVLALGLLLIGGGAALAANTQTMSIWFNRNVLLGNRQWPQPTYFIVRGLQSDGGVRLPRGDSWRQEIAIDPESRVIPSEVLIEFRPARARPPQQMQRTQADKLLFVTTFPSVIEEFQFRAVAGRSASEWIPVTLVDRPAVRKLDIRVTPPAYTNQPTETLSAESGPYAVLPGSTLELIGQANKPLAEARLEFVDPERLTPLRDPLPMTITQKNTFAATLAPDAWLPPRGDAEPITRLKLQLHLRDNEGLDSRSPTTLGVNVRPDRPPRLRAKFEGVTGMVTANATVPLEGDAADDFQIADLWLDIQSRREGSETPIAAQSRSPEITQQLPAAELPISQRVEIKDFNIPAGSTLWLRVMALDNDNVSGPNRGESSELLLRVVTEEELRTDLLRREKEQRQEFERLIKEQETLTTECQALAAEIGATPAPQSEQASTLRTQRNSQNKASENILRVSQRLVTHLAEIRNNRLEEEDGPFQRRLLGQIVTPMEELAEVKTPAAVRSLDRARRLADNPPERQAAFAEATRQQEEILADMRTILSHMVKVEGYQEALNLLHEIEKTQRSVFDLTAKERQDRIRAILEGEKKEDNEEN